MQNREENLKAFLNESLEENKGKTHTKGNIIVEDIKIGDIHYEFAYGFGIEVKVLSLPVMKDNCFVWESKNVRSGAIVNYAVDPKYSHYGPNIYDYKAYSVSKWV